MGTVRIPRDVMLFCSIIYIDRESCERALSMLGNAFSKPCFVSPVLAFDYTSYYEKEMGSPLSRTIVAFEKLVTRDSLPAIKLRTNTMEESCIEDGKRTINLDPGYLSLENVCLATTKPYSHRLYLSLGIWAEVTLFYKDGSYQAFPWTYPDYASDELKPIFNRLRSIYKGRITCQAA